MALYYWPPSTSNPITVSSTTWPPRPPARHRAPILVVSAVILAFAFAFWLTSR